MRAPPQVERPRAWPCQVSRSAAVDGWSIVLWKTYVLPPANPEPRPAFRKGPPERVSGPRCETSVTLRHI